MEAQLSAGPPELFRRFGVRLKAWRAQQHYTARQLAAVTAQNDSKGLSDTYILLIENGRRVAPAWSSPATAALACVVHDSPSNHELVLWSLSGQYARLMRGLALEVLHTIPPNLFGEKSDPPSPWFAVWRDLIPVLFGGQVVEDRVTWDEVTAEETVRRAEIADVIDWLTTTTTDLHLQFDAPAQAESPEPGPPMVVAAHLRLGGVAQVQIGTPGDTQS